MRATEPTRAAIAARRPDVVVHDILTLAPALAAELEGIPHSDADPAPVPGDRPGLRALLDRRAAPTHPRRNARFWSTFERPLERGLRQGRDELNETRRRLGLRRWTRLHGGLSADLCLVATFPQLEYPREWPAAVHVVGPMFWEPPRADAVRRPPGERTAGGGRAVDLARSGSASDPSRTRRDCVGWTVRVLASLDRRPVCARRSAPDACPAGQLDVICGRDARRGAGDLSRRPRHGRPRTRARRAGARRAAQRRHGRERGSARLGRARRATAVAVVSAVTMRLAVERALDEHQALSARAHELAAWAASQRWSDPCRRADRAAGRHGRIGRLNGNGRAIGPTV